MNPNFCHQINLLVSALPCSLTLIFQWKQYHLPILCYFFSSLLLLLPSLLRSIHQCISIKLPSYLIKDPQSVGSLSSILHHSILLFKVFLRVFNTVTFFTCSYSSLEPQHLDNCLIITIKFISINISPSYYQQKKIKFFLLDPLAVFQIAKHFLYNYLSSFQFSF